MRRILGTAAALTVAVTLATAAMAQVVPALPGQGAAGPPATGSHLDPQGSHQTSPGTARTGSH